MKKEDFVIDNMPATKTVLTKSEEGDIMEELLWNVKCLCNLIGNSTYRTITKDIEDRAQVIRQHHEVVNATMPEEERNLMAKVQTVYCGGSLVGPVK